MVRGTTRDPDIFLLRDGIFLGEGTKLGHFVVLDRSTKILFGVDTHRLAFFKSEVREEIDFEGAPESLVFFFDEDGQTVASSISWKTKMVWLKSREGTYRSSRCFRGSRNLDRP